MGGFEFDRKPFARPEEPERKPRRPSAVPGAIIVLVLVALGAYVVYQFMNVRKGPPASQNAVALQQIQKRLDALEHRVDQMDRTHRAFRARRSAATAAPEEARHSVARMPVHYPALVAGVSPHQDLGRVRPATHASGPASLLQGKSSKGSASANPHAIQPQARAAAQQEWEATANRLGDIVGELATQRNEIDQTQASVGQLSESLGRKSTPFALEKGASPQRVGPVQLSLEKTDVRNQRYTMRLFMGDQSIELKNRALHEAIQFYPPGGGVSFDLVVSRIRKDFVSGKLTLPVASPARSGAQESPATVMAPGSGPVRR